MLEPQNTKR